MKALIIAIGLVAASASAYCEIGSKIYQEYVGGGQLVTYDFGQGRILRFKFPSGAQIPYSIRYDFYKYEVCYY